YKVSGDTEALELAIRTFQWMEDKVHDSIYGGYIECLNRDGSPEEGDTNPLIGLKEFNSSLHILEAFTELYRVWPDKLLRERLEEMFLIFRDTIIHPDGYLKLYFYTDWTLVPKEIMLERNGAEGHWYTQHVTFGHDVETAFLLLEAAHELGLEEDHLSHVLAKQLVDHSLEKGWDQKNGGFLYAGHKENGETTIIDDGKAFWVESEGLNALMLMETLYPNDPDDYYYSFLEMWNYIDTYLVDKEHGGWYNFGLDTKPENKTDRKSHNWKGTYHDVRGMVRSIEMLRAE
nr:AGE family epimerase/isomerase [Bacteroidales bacterium]